MEQNKRAGQRGEQITKKETEKLGSDFLRVNSRRLSLGRVSQNAELDHILIGSAGVFVIDSKNWLGEITFKNPGITQVRPDGTKEEYNGDKDPTSQLEHQTYVVAQALNQLGLSKVDPYVKTLIFRFK